MSSLLIIDDHALVREGMVQVLAKIPGVTTVHQVGDGESALELLESHGVFGLVLLDLKLPGISGLSLLRILHKRFPDMPVIVVSAGEEEVFREKALAAGALAFASKTHPVSELVEIVRGIVAARARENGARAAREGNAYEKYGLSAAQSRVLELLITGKSNREIGEVLGLAEGTVKVHVSAILRILNVSNRTQALLLVANGGDAA